jgi:succinoglycan biosynthesis transport protein ExoP
MRLQFRLQSAHDVIEFLRKRVWWIALPIAIIGPTGSIVVRKLPDSYRSDTVILVEPQKIDPNFVRNPISVNVKDRLDKIRNKIMSSTNLASIVTKFHLFEYQSIPLTEQAKIELLRKRIQIYVDQPFGGQGGVQVSYFSISYEDRNPHLAQAVTAEIAVQFLSEEDVQGKEKMLTTSSFIDNQLARSLADLEAKKRDLSQARLQGVVNMPLDAATYAKQLDNIEEELRGVREGIGQWQDRLASVERELNTTPQTVTREVATYESGQDNQPATKMDLAIPSAGAALTPTVDVASIEAELGKLRKTYTDEHPDVRRLLRQLERAQAQLSQSSSSGDSFNEKEPTYKTVTAANPSYRRLSAQTVQIRRTIDTQQNKLSVLEKQRASLEQRLAQWPRITQFIADKTAEMQSLEAQYTALKGRQQEIRLSMELADQAQTEQFRIQDAANLPEKPVGPNRPKLLLANWFAALCLGFGLALARDLIDQSVRTPSDITSIRPVPILVSIPPIFSNEERAQLKQRRRYLMGLYIASGAAVVSLLILVVLNERLFQKVMDYVNVYFA